MKRIKVSSKDCVGCELCGITCSVTHSGNVREAGMRIRIKRQFPERADRPFQPAVCQQCEKPKCVEACPKGALIPNSQKEVIQLNEETCDGCGACIEACPFDAIWIDPLRQVAVKCDLCQGNPQCVHYCQFGAIQSPFAV
jgi:anaerobic carbon-monoxide dehydrogenase iron sulfur subunit